jgi:hypothetical protein
MVNFIVSHDKEIIALFCSSLAIILDQPTKYISKCSIPYLLEFMVFGQYEVFVIDFTSRWMDNGCAEVFRLYLVLFERCKDGAGWGCGSRFGWKLN